MKKIIVLALTAVFASAILMSCEKEKTIPHRNSNTQIPEVYEKEISTNDFVMISSFDSTIYCFSGTDVLDRLLWNVKSNGENILDANVYFDISEYENAQYHYNSTDTSLLIISGDTQISFDAFSFNDNLLSFVGQGANSRPVNFSIYSKKYDLSKYHEQFQEKAAPIAYFIYAAACIIAAGVDMYCDHRVQKQVAECTANGKCSIVTTCGADCVECKKP